MNDILLDKFFEPERWEYAIEKGIGKDIDKAQLRQLCKPEVRVKMCEAMLKGSYNIFPPHTAKIPKDVPGEFRTVYVNEPVDRVVLSIANDLLFEVMADRIHPRCKSYLKGVGCGKVVREVSRVVCDSATPIVGWKSDLSKYFDSVPLEYIDREFDRVEERYGKSALVDVIRKYYHCNLYFDTDGNLQEAYQSLKQGCSVASYLADAILYHIDEALASLDGFYARYSDDTIFLGKDYERAMQTMQEELAKMQMKINPKKIEYIDKTHWFKFLGFSIKGASISLSSTRIKSFQKEIEARTIRKNHKTVQAALSSVYRFLYKGNGKHSWATQVLPVVNVREDIHELDKFVMDCIRAAISGKHKLGGLGFDKAGKVGCIQRGRGRNVTANRLRLARIDGYQTISCMQDNIKTSKAVYEAMVRQM